MDYIDMEIMWIRQRRVEKIGRSGMGRQGRMGEKDGNGGGQEGQEGHKGQKGQKRGMKNRIKDYAKNVNVSLQTDNGSKVGYLYAKWAKRWAQKQDQKYFNFSQLAYKLTLGQRQASNAIWAKEGFKWNKLGKWEKIKA